MANPAATETEAAAIPTPSSPWYADESIGRDRSHVLEKRETKWETVCHENSLFVVLTSKGMYHQVVVSNKNENVPSPVVCTFNELSQLVGEDKLKESMQSSEKTNILAWVGELDHHNYWAYYTSDFDEDQEAPLAAVAAVKEDSQLQITNLREFGDSLLSSTDAAILATCNGLVEFHKSHMFCSKCGSPTRTSKAGGSRECTSTDCGSSVYPRIDVASIMLITTRCEKYALLGRKENWPQGRYSTLAGFAEIGETMEQCCARETMEESGVAVDPASLNFVCSQPWPFPRSLIVGFRAKAKEWGQPTIQIEEMEMEDIQWFHKDYVRDHLEGGSTAMSFQPNEKEAEFHVPGPASLGRMLIEKWVNEE